MAAFGRIIGTEQDVEPEAPDPETFALALVMSGHVHQYRLLRLDGTDHLWAPSAWAVLPDQVQPILGMKRCGIVSLDLASGMSPEPVLVNPDGIAQLTVGTDIPDPYHS